MLDFAFPYLLQVTYPPNYSKRYSNHVNAIYNHSLSPFSFMAVYPRVLWQSGRTNQGQARGTERSEGQRAGREGCHVPTGTTLGHHPKRA